MKGGNRTCSVDELRFGLSTAGDKKIKQERGQRRSARDQEPALPWIESG
jgi:hypothetical protein